MHHSFKRLDAVEIVAIWSGDPLPPLALPVTARGEHARMLDIAAARRRRAIERAAVCRFEDADYWKAVAPAAVSRARATRGQADFTPLP